MRIETPIMEGLDCNKAPHFMYMSLLIGTHNVTVSIQEGKEERKRRQA
jgi:hypothetical protein